MQNSPLFSFFFSISFEIWMNGSSLEEGRWDWMGSVDIVRGGSWRTQQRWSPLLIVNHIKVSNSKPSKGKMTKSLFISFSLTLAVCLIFVLGCLTTGRAPKGGLMIFISSNLNEFFPINSTLSIWEEINNLIFCNKFPK